MLSLSKEAVQSLQVVSLDLDEPCDKGLALEELMLKLKL